MNKTLQKLCTEPEEKMVHHLTQTKPSMKVTLFTNSLKLHSIIFLIACYQFPPISVNKLVLFLDWLVTNPKLYFPLDQDLSELCKKRLEEIVLWKTDMSTLSKDFTCCRKYDGVIQVKLNVGYICLLSFFLML